MTNQNLEALYKQLSDMADAGDEAGARKFVKEHLLEFPEDMQKKIVFEFFVEAMEKEVESNKQKAEIQCQGMDMIKDIEKTELAINDKKKMADVRSNLDTQSS